MLACCGLYHDAFDGMAGANTRNAIIEFQTILSGEDKPIVIDGVCGEVTWKYLIERHS